jgi:RND family efflux transporter MFP subunit
MNKRFFVIISIVGIGFLLAATVIKTAPKPMKKTIVAQAPLVEVAGFNSSETRPSWQGGASVNANKSVNLVAQVSGQIVTMNPLAVPGSFVKKGTILATIDDANYRLVLQQKKAKVIQAQSSLDMEQAQVQNAKKDYQRSGIKLNSAGKALALRQPQLASAKAALNIANTDLKKARLDVSRTRVSMPFDGHVLSHKLTKGAFVNNTSAVFEVLNAQQYWLELKVPQEFIEVLDQDYPVEVARLNQVESRQASILTILPQVDAMDRQARILISIDNPLGLNGVNSDTSNNISNQKPLSIRYNEFVQVTLFAMSFSDALKIKTDTLNGSNKVWVVDGNMQLQHRSVTVLYSGREFSWVKIQTQAQDQMLLSSLDSPKEGQTVRLKTDVQANERTVKTEVETEVKADVETGAEVVGQ